MLPRISTAAIADVPRRGSSVPPLRIGAVHGSRAPETASSFAIPNFSTPFTCENMPPATTCWPSSLTSIPSTCRFEVGAHPSRPPSSASNAAKLRRDWFPTLVKDPPTYTTSSVAAIASTLPLTGGAKSSISSNDVASNTAIRFRGSPSMVENSPPT